MILYLTLFIFFIALYKWAELRESKWLLFFAILLPTLFEGLRDDVVGEDMLGYGGDWFDYMDENDSVMTMFDLAQTPEYAYHLLIYICKNIFPDIHLFMTACALIKMTAVTLFAYRMREQLSSILFLFSYYCFFYVTSFSMMRQGVAVALCIYSLYYFMNQDIKRFLLVVAVSYFFHNSAILMLLLIPLYYMRNFRYKYILILGSSFFIYTSVEVLFELVLMSPLFKSEMADLYIDSGVASAKTNLLISTVFLGYGAYLFFSRKIKTKEMEGENENEIEEEQDAETEEENEIWKEDTNTYLLIVTSTLTLVFLLLASYIEVAFRMSYYMYIVSVMIVLMFVYISDQYRLIKVGAFVSLFLLHFYIACSHGLVGALEYSSSILGVY